MQPALVCFGSWQTKISLVPISRSVRHKIRVAVQPPDALLVTAEAFTRRYQSRILDFANSNKIPAMFEDGGYVEAGGLMSYGPDYPAVFAKAAIFVDKILKGAKPADLPVEQPTKFELVINLRTAKALGLEIPPTLIALADRVIE